MGELRLGRVPDFDGVGVLADQVFQVGCQGAAVPFQASAGGVDTLRDVEDDGGEAVFVEVDFLVVGDFADCAGGHQSQYLIPGTPAQSPTASTERGGNALLDGRANVPHIGKVVGQVADKRAAEEAGLSEPVGHGDVQERCLFCAIKAVWSWSEMCVYS